MQTLLSSPEVVWSAIAGFVGSVGVGARKVLHMDSQISDNSETISKLEADLKEDLAYVRSRLDALTDYLLEQ